MKHLAEKPLKLTICSCPTHLPIVRAAIEKLCEKIGFDPEAVGKVILSTDEALTNIIRHAYQGADDRPIEIDLVPLIEGPCRGLRICIRDYGQHVDRSLIRSRDLGDVRPGGLGVHIMTECMDGLEYRAAEGGGTVLTMTKAVRPSRQESPT
jgi:anti-sigma regulatory factor (Ser/Thr protein kinase)